MFDSVSRQRSRSGWRGVTKQWKGGENSHVEHGAKITKAL
jgi:hypothetical protein